jgi:hypothetical protein
MSCVLYKLTSYFCRYLSVAWLALVFSVEICKKTNVDGFDENDEPCVCQL